MLEWGVLVNANKLCCVGSTVGDNKQPEQWTCFMVDVTFQFNRKVQPIAIYPRLDVPDGSKVTVMGWGYTDPDIYKDNSVLMKVELEVWPLDECREFWENYATKVKITDKMICAGRRDKIGGGCQGDSGGPLIFKGKLIGIVSGGVDDCGAKNEPEGFYTRVAAYKEWIDSHAVRRRRRKGSGCIERFSYSRKAKIKRPPKIVGGEPATVEEFPFIVALVRKTEKNILCGGSIISEKYALTAAHCVYNYVRSKNLDFGKSEKSKLEAKGMKFLMIMIAVTRRDRIMNEDVKYGDGVDVTFQFNRKVQTIAIYPRLDVPDGSKVTVMGWGYTDPDIYVTDYSERRWIFNSALVDEVDNFDVQASLEVSDYCGHATTIAWLSMDEEKQTVEKVTARLIDEEARLTETELSKNAFFTSKASRYNTRISWVTLEVR
uniref:Peptidase S1 domain-containing protein n=1 Tax=Timema cristinae TaxID=61476 RepID=A0A7R9GYB4_TIMCR|nr:unnamed protein product [Timema cristinae]